MSKTSFDEILDSLEADDTSETTVPEIAPSKHKQSKAAPVLKEEHEPIETQNDLNKPSFDISDLTPVLKEKLDKHSDLVNKAYDIFKSIYSNAMKKTVISSIINGETIETKPENIFINEDIAFDDPSFEKKCELCTKNLYNYQKNAIKKLRELELRGYYKTKTGEKIISNGWLLNLPIGSGKSLIFSFLALFYREIPCHPIIISIDGHNIPENDAMQWKYYPYYYENCGYIENSKEPKFRVNSIIAHTNYQQRKTTIILTHAHLLEQMEMYFNEDFPTIIKTVPEKKPKVAICYPIDLTTINISNYDIIVTPANTQNINILVEASYAMPFLRVIIDDYTSMPDIECFRQILASSTIFVSGSGFNRKEEEIPPSYYTLKFMPVPKISLVGKPEETLEGIFRDSIVTMELMGSRCEFSQYEFVAQCDEIIKQRFDTLPMYVYPLIKKEPLIHHYMSLMFLLKYFDRMKKAIMCVDKDLKTIVNSSDNDNSQNKDSSTERQTKLNKSRVSYYLEWKQMLADTIANPPPVETRIINNKPKKIKLCESMNPLYQLLFEDPRLGNNAGSGLVQQSCIVCNRKITDHNGYGMVACCCGAFYCSNCLKAMCTKCICNKETGESIIDSENYYCCCCRAKNPRYYMNVNKKKDSNVYSYNLINDFFETKDLEEHSTFDYYFYMFLHGFKPLYKEGKPLNIDMDIKQKCIDSKCFLKKQIPVLEKILPKDQLGILSIGAINKTLFDLQILPKKGAIILFYMCPQYMKSRVMNYYNEIVTKNNKSTALTIKRDKKIIDIQPISNLQIEFKESVASLIGLHKNIVGIIAWEEATKADERDQLFGRILRLSSFGNKLYFYVTINNIGYN